MDFMNDLLLDTLFTYETWATRHVLEECRNLTQEQFERELGLGHGNLERTLSHLIGSMLFFTDRLNRKTPRPRPDRDGRSRTPDELLALFEGAAQEFREAVAHSARHHSMMDILNWTDDDSADVDPLDQVTYAVAFAQMLDHSNHHRTQSLDMLRLSGVDKPMEWHPFEWDEAMRS